MWWKTARGAKPLSLAPLVTRLAADVPSDGCPGGHVPDQEWTHPSVATSAGEVGASEEGVAPLCSTLPQLLSASKDAARTVPDSRVLGPGAVQAVAEYACRDRNRP